MEAIGSEKGNHTKKSFAKGDRLCSVSERGSCGSVSKQGREVNNGNGVKKLTYGGGSEGGILK